MILTLFFLNIHKPKELLRKIRVILAYRKAQEALRNSGGKCKSPSRVQIKLTSEMTGESAGYITGAVREWFERRPLRYLRLCRRRGMFSLIDSLHQMGFKLGVYSDYPAEDKLISLGISKYMMAVVSAHDPAVRGFKPETNGFAVAAQRMGLKPPEILYVGDRPDVDVPGAQAEGMRVIIIGTGIKRKRRNRDHLSATSFREILQMLKPAEAGKSFPS